MSSVQARILGLLRSWTVGTHHPFVFPEDSAAGDTDETDRPRAAFIYADSAIGWLVEELDRRGVFDDTLVLITSDESRGVLTQDPRTRLGIDNVTRRLTQNWGVLVAIQPEGRDRSNQRAICADGYRPLGLGLSRLIRSKRRFFWPECLSKL